MTLFLFLRIKRLRTKNEMSWTQVGKGTGKKKIKNKKACGEECASQTLKERKGGKTM